MGGSFHADGKEKKQGVLLMMGVERRGPNDTMRRLIPAGNGLTMCMDFLWHIYSARRLSCGMELVEERAGLSL